MCSRRVLTEKQRKVLDYIISRQKEEGSPPTIREISGHFGYRSPGSVSQHLLLIEKKGYISRDPGKARGIKVCKSPERGDSGNTVSVPLLGEIAAGTPTLAVENIESHIILDSDFFPVQSMFALTVKGDSMKDVGIMDGDIALIRQQNSVDNGDIAAVMVDDEATLKRVFAKRREIVLKAENDAYDDIVLESGRDVSVLGKYVGIIRKKPS